MYKRKIFQQSFTAKLKAKYKLSNAAQTDTSDGGEARNSELQFSFPVDTL